MAARDTKNEHHLILEKYTPESLVALRTELVKPENSDIFNRAIKEPTFEGALATIGECLDIALDGMYDVADLCDVLVSAMRKRSLYGNQPHLRDSRLCNVEMIERDGTVELEEISNGIPGTISSASEKVGIAKARSESDVEGSMQSETVGNVGYGGEQHCEQQSCCCRGNCNKTGGENI